MSRASLQTYIDTNLSTNGAQDITGAELDTFLTNFLADSLLISEVDGSTLEYSGGVLRIKDAGVTLAKMANLAQSTIIGRAAGAGTGVPTALTATQVKTLLAIASTDVSGLGTAATVNTGTSGATIPLNNGNNVFSGVALSLNTGSHTALVYDRPSGSVADIQVKTSGALRWLWRLVDTTAETGADTGSNMQLAAYTDAGASNNVLNIPRSTRIVNFTLTPTAGGVALLTTAAGGVTLAMMANLAQSTIIGRAAAAGTGVPTALTATQVKTLLAIGISDVTSLQSSLDAKLDLVGGTLTGALTISMASALLTLDAAASGQTRALRFRTAGATRWQVNANNTAEGGSNAGSDFTILRYDDAGVIIAGTPFKITRSTGNAVFGGTVDVTALKINGNEFPEYQASAVNGNVTITTVSPITTFFTTATLTANRTMTIATTNAQAGWIIFVRRTGGDTGGPWSFNINGGLKTLISGGSGMFIYNGTAWDLVL